MEAQMADSTKRQLTYEEATETWLLRYEGVHLTRICAKFDVDPRRLYEVWEEKKHIGSRQEAEGVINKKLAEGACPTKLRPHEPKLRVVYLPSKNQTGDQMDMDV
jgi:hypothetical protein